MEPLKRQEAWRDSRHVFGVDGETVTSFAANADRNVRLISRELREQNYQPAGLQPVFLPKGEGKARVIAIPTIRDRVVQAALLDYLSAGDRCKVTNAASYGFVPGRGVKRAALRAASLRNDSPWVYKTDIASFFDSLDREELKERVSRAVRARSLHKILAQFIDTDVELAGTTDRRLKKAGIRRGRGIRQGMPLSPLLTNIYLRDFDNEVLANGFSVVRYADDFVVLCASKSDCLHAHEFVSSALEKVGLSIHPLSLDGKTQIYDPQETVEFLGVGLQPIGGRYSVRLTNSQLQSIKQDIHILKGIKELTRRGVTLPTLGACLNAKISGYKGAYEFCENFLNLDHALDAWHRDILRSIYTELGMDVEHLTYEQCVFLGVAARQEKAAA